jgi:hypothetical protein
MTSQHSPTPWVAEDDFIIDANGESVGWAVHNPVPILWYIPKEDADRIIACVNACEGIPNEELYQIKQIIQRYFQLHHEGGPPA